MLDRRLVAIARTVVGLAAIAIVFITAAICTLQAIAWVKTGAWGSLPASQILELAGIEIGRTYVSSSGDSQAQSRSSIASLSGGWTRPRSSPAGRDGLVRDRLHVAQVTRRGAALNTIHVPVAVMLDLVIRWAPSATRLNVSAGISIMPRARAVFSYFGA